MTITVLLDPAQMPDQSQDQLDFDNKMSGVMRDLPTWGAQANLTEANMNAMAAGGAYALPYVFDTATADADPGAGKLRLSSTTQSAATVIRLDLTGAGQDYTTLIDTMDASTNFIKGSIRLIKQGDLSKWMTFDLTARAAPSGYRNLMVVCTGSSSASPFVKDDPLLLFFQRAGDRGAVGGRDVVLAEYKVTTAVAAIDFPNIITDEYDDFSIEYSGLVGGVALNTDSALTLALFANNVLQTSGYGPLSAGTILNDRFTASLWSLGAVLHRNAASGPRGADGRVRIIGARRTSNSLRSIVLSQSRIANNSGNWSLVFDNLQSAALIANPVSGARLALNGANFTEGTVRIIGHRNN